MTDIFSVSNDDLSQEVRRLVDLKGEDNWADVRGLENFDIVKRNYPFGERTCLARKKLETYENLQSSRGIGIKENDTLSRILEDIQDQMELIESDWVRISEIEEIISKHREIYDLGPFKKAGFVELGFRVPRLMKHYAGSGHTSCWGYDIAPLSLAITKHLGFDARRYDFDSCEDKLDLDGANLVVTYHMLEHLSDPLPAVKKIFDSMDKDSYLHVEIPIEPGFPRVAFAHMFPFEPKDMLEMLKMAGFLVLYGTTKTHTGGPHVERYTAYKG